MTPIILTICVILAVVFHLWSEYSGTQTHIYISKPLPVLLILVIAFTAQSTDPFYKYIIIAGLVFSLAGDIFLMLPSDRFVAGLAAFLVAHLFYIAAFASGTGTFVWWPLIPLGIFGVVVYSILAPSLDDKKLPVFIYLLVIMVMIWLASELWIHTNQTSALLAFTGAVLFVVSDTILAINKFHVKFKPARALNLSTYFAAQWFIAMSIGISLP